jgi:flavin-binding protein dodecin
MSRLNELEVIEQSDRSWEDAAHQALNEALKKVRNIQTIDIKDFQVIVKDDKILNYRLNAKISFLVEDE